MYSISEFAKLINVTPTTLRTWDKIGKLNPIKLESGHRRYTKEHLSIINGIKEDSRLNIIYCRESTKQQSNSLIEQESKLKDFCIAKGIPIHKVISEFGSALNYNRKGFQELLSLINDNLIENLIIYYKDRLVRFGFEIIEFYANKNNFNIIIVDDSESNKTKEQEFAEDLISIIHFFSMKLYGSRNYKSKIKNAEQNLIEIKNEISKS